MNYSILYRNYEDWKVEADAAKQHFHCTDSMVLAPENSTIIGRYSVLPFYRDVEREISHRKSKLINSYAQHRYIADLRNWYIDLKEFTPKTWDRLEYLPEEGPFILKGETNSRKGYWNTHMFAKNKREAIEVHGRLLQDSLISEQNIVIRQYIPLHTYAIGIQGVPITKEFRFFILHGNILSGGYYWSNYVDEIEVPPVYEVPIPFLKKVISKIRGQANFYVIDVAQTQSGDWIVIELNDGQCSGLSENDPNVLYNNMKLYLDSGKRKDHHEMCSKAVGDVSACLCDSWFENDV